MTIRVRPAVPGDVATLTEYNRLLAWETEGKELDPALLAAGVAAGLADLNRALYFVAETEGEGPSEVVGQLMLTREWSDWRNGWIWWIQSVYVRQSHRRRGVFRLLYQHTHQTALAQPDVVGLRLYVEEHNAVAQAVYRSLGMASPGYLVLERCPL